VILAFVGIQFFRPEITNPPVTADLDVPVPVKNIVKNSCYNCHSNETQLSWFDHIVPAIWLVAHDVEEGRKHLNFSDWGKMDPVAQKAAWFDLTNQILNGAMPLGNYTMVHPSAKISDEQKEILRNYAATLFVPVVEDDAKIDAAQEQYDQWIEAAGQTRVVQDSLNGIAFIPDYKNWKVVSTTDRSDNGTMRVILGNDVAIQAIKNEKTNPWPDGTTFAKVAWEKILDDSGVVRTGSFKHVEFMIKDAQKYKNTDGWGWARWKGLDLVPYGKDANLAQECMGCHAPMKNRDFVFTDPTNIKADHLEWKVISSFIDPETKTMSTIYGSDATVAKARAGGFKKKDTERAELSLMSWAQVPDPRWFGAEIPGELKTTQKIKVDSSFQLKSSIFP